MILKLMNGRGPSCPSWRTHLQHKVRFQVAARRPAATPAAERLNQSVSCGWAALPAYLVDGMHPGSVSAAGFVVGRYCCRTFEVKRRQMYEKALDALATSPVARGVNRWLLAGDWDTVMCS